MPVCAVVFGVRSGCGDGARSLARRLARGDDGWPGAIPDAPTDSIRFRRDGMGTTR